MKKINVDVCYGTPFPSKIHIVLLDEDKEGHANFVCTGKRLKYQGLSAGISFDEVTCQKCIKKIKSGRYQHINEDLR